MKRTAFLAVTLATALTLTVTVANASEVKTDNGNNTFTEESTGRVYASATEVGLDKSILAANTGKGVIFTDLKGYDWAEDSINAMASKGIVKGVGGGLYAPAANVTRQEFASMIIRSFGTEKVEALAKQASEKAKTDSNYTSLDKINETYPDNWSNEVLCAIQMFPELDVKWQVSKIYWGEKATRSEMAFIIMTIAEQLGNEKFEIKENIQNNIGDMAYISNDSNKDDILKAYSAGILVGTNKNGDFSPNQQANRAEAAIVLDRVVNPSKRTEVVIKTPEVVPPVQEGSNIGELGAVYPKEGDIINGKAVTRDSATGILGLDVKGGIYLGLNEVYPDGTVHQIKVGSRSSDNYDNMKYNDVYSDHGGYIFWSSEFEILNRYATARLPQADAAHVGQKADILGNIIKAGSSEPVFYECIYNPGMNNYRWDDLY